MPHRLLKLLRKPLRPVKRQRVKLPLLMLLRPQRLLQLKELLQPTLRNSLIQRIQSDDNSEG